MKRWSTLGVVTLGWAVISAPAALHAQTEDEMMDTIRARTDIGRSDQERMELWIKGEIAGFRSFKAFRQRFQEQFGNARNSQQFRTHFATLTASVAASLFSAGGLKGDTAHAVAQVLVDLNRVETHAMLIACLGADDARARYLCADGLVGLKRQIVADNALVPTTVDALRGAGLKETDGVVLGRIYDALAMPEKLGNVFDAFLALFDKRLEVRRRSGQIHGGPELYAYEFFRAPAVRNALDQTQKTQLVLRLAVFLRLDAERYHTVNLGFDEVDRLERMLDAEEDILAGLAGDSGGKIRQVLSSGGYEARSTIPAEAYRWIGDPTSQTPGPLNQAPWNVPVGAP